MKKKERALKFALAGNPNCGKTTLFNRITGSSQSVGNWPGVTVERKAGTARAAGALISVVDLPGIYSLAPYSPEEKVAHDYLLSGEPDLILDVVDATNLERNLYLTTQLSELGIPMAVALNMADEVEKHGETIDCALLSRKLGVPVVSVSASRGTGVGLLLKAAVETAREKASPLPARFYSPALEQAIRGTEEAVRTPCTRWRAVGLLEGSEPLSGLAPQARRKIEALRKTVPVTEALDLDMIVADQRYRFLGALCRSAVRKTRVSSGGGYSEKIDRVLAGRFLGLPLFFLFMLGVFWVTFGAPGSFLGDWLNGRVLAFSRFLDGVLRGSGTQDWARSLAVDGILGGVGAVFVFLPQIVLLFAMLSFLEDSGYMARAVFMMDRLLRKIGLSGRAFVPLLMGFGCTVPAVMSTRILEREKDRRLTVLIVPFMSCSAKMPVYSLIISALFAGHRALTVFSVYALGIVLGVLSALLFKNTILQGEPAPFVMELPPYRVPTFQNLRLHVWQRLKDFLQKAGTVLLFATVAVWFLQYFTPSMGHASDPSQSILAAAGKRIAPVFTLCGFGEWRQAVSLVTGLVAKESVVSTMRVLYPAGVSGSLAEALKAAFTPDSAYAFLIFVLLYTPCVAALSAIRREMGSLKWTALTVGYQMGLAWFASAFFYQWATLLRHIF